MLKPKKEVRISQTHKDHEHALTLVSGDERLHRFLVGSFKCNACYRTYPESVVSHSCDLCNFDLCRNCSLTS